MYKLLIFDMNYEVTNISPIDGKYEYDLSGIKSYLTGSSSPFIVVDESRPISSVTKEEVIEFLLTSQLNRLSAERDVEIETGFYSEIKNANYWFGVSDQADFTQQLVLLALDLSIDNIQWRTKNGVFDYTREEFLTVAKDAEAHKRKWKQVLWAVEDSLKIAVTEYEHLFEIKNLREEATKLGITL
jgi:hypothetical protein